MNQSTQQLLTWARELQAIATAGLFYSQDPFDRERFEQIQKMAAEMTSQVSELSWQQIQGLFQREDVYQTPKIDSRAIVFNEREEVLLICERDHTWAPPGGWCEHDLPPAANAVKEAREEAGVDVEPYRLVAVHDQHIHNDPWPFFTVERFFFLCRLLGGEFRENIETLESGWFPLDALPPLSARKISREQLQLCLAAHRAPDWETRFDVREAFSADA